MSGNETFFLNYQQNFTYSDKKNIRKSIKIKFPKKSTFKTKKDKNINSHKKEIEITVGTKNTLALVKESQAIKKTSMMWPSQNFLVYKSTVLI